VHFEGEVEVTAAAATAVDDVNIKTFSTKDAEDDQADADQPEEETVTETTVEVTTETEIVAELVIDDEVLDDDETALDTDAIHDGYVDDLPDFEEVLRANDPKVLAAEIAAELRKDRLAELVASVRSDD
jgi:hypothetical protein